MPSNRLRIDSIDLENILSQEEFSKLHIKKFSKGNIEYDDGNLVLYVFKSGKAKALIYEDAEEFVMYYLLKNNIIIPEKSCVIEFMEDSEVYTINAELFYQLFSNKAFAISVIQSLKHRAEIERSIIKNLVFKSCKEKISSFLVEVALTQNNLINNQYHIVLNLSMKDLASFIGSKRQTVSTIMNEMIKEKIIGKVNKNEFVILDMERLETYE